MSINYVVIAKDLATWASAAKVALGGVIHKVWSALVGAEKKAKAEIAKLEADAAAAIKKL